MEQGYAIGGRCQAIPADTRGEDLLERILLPAECGGTAIATVQRLSIEEGLQGGLRFSAKLFPLRAISVEHDEDGGVRIHVPDAEMRVEAISLRVEGHYLSLARAAFAPHAVLA